MADIDVFYNAILILKNLILLYLVFKHTFKKYFIYLILLFYLFSTNFIRTYQKTKHYFKIFSQNILSI